MNRILENIKMDCRNDILDYFMYVLYFIIIHLLPEKKYLFAWFTV